MPFCKVLFENSEIDALVDGSDATSRFMLPSALFNSSVLQRSVSELIEICSLTFLCVFIGMTRFMTAAVSVAVAAAVAVTVALPI